MASSCCCCRPPLPRPALADLELSPELVEVLIHTSTWVSVVAANRISEGLDWDHAVKLDPSELSHQIRSDMFDSGRLDNLLNSNGSRPRLMRHRPQSEKTQSSEKSFFKKYPYTPDSAKVPATSSSHEPNAPPFSAMNLSTGEPDVDKTSNPCAKSPDIGFFGLDALKAGVKGFLPPNNSV